MSGLVSPERRVERMVEYLGVSSYPSENEPVRKFLIAGVGMYRLVDIGELC